MFRRVLFLAIFAMAFAVGARAETSNGNDFALAFSEAKTPGAKKTVVDDALGRPHIFRYLQIKEMQDVTENGRTGVRIAAVEPSSKLIVKFTVTMPVSLGLLKEEPAVKVGDALAVLGRFSGIDPAGNSILLDSPIVRHKDLLSPMKGKELLSDTNPNAIVYSYTEGPRPINVEARDRDLVSHRDEILGQGGPTAWAAYLETEIAKRKAQRAAAGKEGGVP